MGMLRAGVGRLLEAVGITEAEESLYRYLLERPGGRVSELARSLGLPAKQIRSTLGALEARGLVSRTTGREARVVAAPPSTAIEALILNRQEQLERARLAAGELDNIFRSYRPKTPSPLDVVEVVVGKEAVDQRFEQLIRIAEEQLLVLDRPPYAGDPAGDNTLGMELLARGVRARTLYDNDALSVPGRMNQLRAFAESGEEARTLPELPMKLFIADQALAFIPLSLDEPGMEGALLVQPSPVLEALLILFEALWERAVPVDFSSGQSASADGAPESLSEEDGEVFSLLLAGLKDQAIARQLGVAPRTVLRRVSNLMQVLHAQTRFQAGWLAARRGWGG